MLARRERLLRGWIERCLIPAIGVTLAATLPLGSSSAVAVSPKHVPASTLLKDACAATLAASAFRVQGHITEGNTTLIVDIYFGSAGTLATVTQHGNQTVNMVMNGPSIYMKANQSFWQAETNNSGDAALGASRWFDVTSDKKDFAGLAKSLDKKALVPHCGQGSSSSYDGTGTVNGIKAIKIHRFSSQRSDIYYIESGSTPYLLRVTGSQSQKDSGDVVFSDYGVQPDTAAPHGAIPFSDFGSTGNSGNSGGTAQQANMVASCEADYKSLEVAVEAYNATVGKYPVPPAPWSASSYASNFSPLESTHVHGGPYLRYAPDPAHYVIEYDAEGDVWIEPAGTYDAKYNPAHAASDKVCASISD
jgi:hypothetical protein